MKKLLSILLAVMMLTSLLASCGSRTETADAKPTGGQAETSAAQAGIALADMRVCAVFPGPRGDSGTVDMACKAIEKISEEAGTFITIVEGDGTGDIAKLESAVRDVSDDGYNIILSTGLMADVYRMVAPDYPETMYCLFDTTFDFTTYDGSNIYCANFLQNEGAYLAGIVAMSMSDTDVIGFIGGMENANICDFMWGYVEGAKSVNPKGTIAVSFTGDWMDSAKAKEIALTQVNMGAKALFPAAGPASEGVMEGAAEAKVYSVGVDIDRESQYKVSNPDWVSSILTSELKRVDVAVERAIRLYSEGKLVPGQEALGIAEGGVGIYKEGNYKIMVPEDVQKLVSDAEQKITNGELTVGTAIGATAEQIAEIKTWAGSQK